MIAIELVSKLYQDLLEEERKLGIPEYSAVLRATEATISKVSQMWGRTQSEAAYDVFCAKDLLARQAGISKKKRRR